ncbi:hypothetical protein [Aquimonas sp.]|jgi:uncharacterized delta-60 repeat protein|uniref:hypothetical protein n=1 Tax=Aquimonas sp. TaxID=1872588 RepID=UPI0037BECE8C
MYLFLRSRSGVSAHRRSLPCALLFWLLLSVAPPSQALPEFYAPDPDGEVLALARDASGRALVGGDFGRIGGAQRRGIARLHANGEADLGFDPGKGANGRVLAVAVAADGSVWIGGEFTAVDGQPRAQIARLSPQGALQPGVGVTAAPNGSVNALLVQADGSVILGGAFTRVGGVDRGRLARLGTDGRLDLAYAVGAGADGRVRALAQRADGRVWVGGEFSSFDAQGAARLTLLDSAGRAVPLPLPLPPALSGAVRALRLDRAERLWVGGQFSTEPQGALRGLVRLSEDGRLDAEIDPQVQGGSGVHALAIDEVDRLLLAGDFDRVAGSTMGGFARLLADGSLDGSFEPDALDTRGARALVRQADGGLLVGGDFSTVGGVLQRGLVRFDEEGLRERPLLNGAFVHGIANALALDAHKRVVLAGGFNRVNGEMRDSLARWSRDGVLDRTFGVSSGLTRTGAFAQAFAQWLDYDGSALLAGEFNRVGAQVREGFARIDSNATVLPPFAAVAVSSAPEVLGLSRDAQGRWLVHGLFTSINGVPRPSLARLFANGSVDPSFAPAGGNALRMTAARVLSDGRVLVAGLFDQYNDQPRRGLAMLTSDGQLAQGFDVPGGVDGTIDLILEMDDGRLLLGGDFSAIGGEPRRHLVRLLPDGQFDPAFRVDAGLDGAVRTAVQQADGRVIIGGDFRNVQGHVQAGIARLLGDGSRDPEFATPGVDPDGVSLVYALALDDRAHLLISGLAVEISGSSRGGMVRLALREPARYSWFLEQADTRLCWAAEGAAPRPFAARFERSDNGSQWSLLGDAERVGARWCFESTAPLAGQWLRVTAQYRSGLAASSTSLLRRVWRAPTRTALFADGFEVGAVR